MNPPGFTLDGSGISLVLKGERGADMILYCNGKPVGKIGAGPIDYTTVDLEKPEDLNEIDLYMRGDYFVK